MSKNVFANGREISAKKDDNKATASMPDVCLSPPSPPAGPVPIPYPNTAMASDTSEGSKSVKIGGSEVGLKNASNYKKSTGDEAATKTLGMGVVSHNITGKLKHAAWSMDVMIEGMNVIRHMDMVTQNHMNCTNAVPGIDIARDEREDDDPECADLEDDSQFDVQEDTRRAELPNNSVMARANVNGVSEKAAAPEAAIMGGNPGARRRGYKPAAPNDGFVPPATETYQDASGRTRSRFVQGTGNPGREPRIACSQERYNARPGSGGGNTHTEGKFIQNAMASGGVGSTITMRINWNDNGELRHEPCSMCQRAICIAIRDCDFKIKLCQEDEEGNLVQNDPDCSSYQ